MTRPRHSIRTKIRWCSQSASPCGRPACAASSFRAPSRIGFGKYATANAGGPQSQQEILLGQGPPQAGCSLKPAIIIIENHITFALICINLQVLFAYCSKVELYG